jgi:hypothetical protein
MPIYGLISCLLLTLIRAARGIYDFRNFEQVELRNALSNENF